MIMTSEEEEEDEEELVVVVVWCPMPSPSPSRTYHHHHYHYHPLLPPSPPAMLLAHPKEEEGVLIPPLHHYECLIRC